jgi:putative peptide zinc metalloprotease protein
VCKAQDPSHTKGEKVWLPFYAVVAIVVRVIVMAAIIVFVGDRLFIIGVMLAAGILAVWLFVPVGKMVRYLATSQELFQVRVRAVFTTLSAGVLLIFAAGLINSPDRCRLEGVVEAVHHAAIHQKTSGFVLSSLSSNTETGPDGPPLVTASSPEMESRRFSLIAELRRLKVRRQVAQTKEAAAAQIIDEEIVALEEQIERVDQGLQELVLKSPVSGTWVAPDIDQTNGMYFRRGRHIGDVVSLHDLRIRAIAGQKEAARLIKEAHQEVEIRVKGRPDIELAGRLEMILPAGYERLPSAALGYAAGGSTQNDMQDSSGRLAAEPFFEILVVPSLQQDTLMRPRQRVVLRFETLPKPLLVQGWRALLQLFQARFQV